MKPLTNLDIDKIMIKCDNYRGTFSKDMLPKAMNKNESAVVNLQDYFAGNGTHWVCVYNEQKSNNVEYFDSFGLVPPPDVVKYMKTTNKNIIYSDAQIQNIDSILCGYYCLYYITERNKGRTANEVMLDFHEKPTAFNEMFHQHLNSRIAYPGILTTVNKKFMFQVCYVTSEFNEMFMKFCVTYIKDGNLLCSRKKKN